MLGRLIAALVFIGCIALFAVGYSDSYLRTGNELMQALGWSDGYERVNAVNREPGYTGRGRLDNGAEAEIEG